MFESLQKWGEKEREREREKKSTMETTESEKNVQNLLTTVQESYDQES
jgi:hypothetical protein